MVTVMMGWPEPELGFPEGLAPDDYDRIAEVTHKTQKAKLLNDSLGICWFAQMGIPGALKFQTGCLEAATGLSLTPEEALDAGERIVVLQRLITNYLGYVPEDDFDMGARMFEKIACGTAAGRGFTRDEFRRLRDEFYTMKGWSLATGVPSDEALERVGLAGYEVGAAARASDLDVGTEMREGRS